MSQLPPLSNPPSNTEMLDKICAGAAGVMGLCTGAAAVVGSLVGSLMLGLPTKASAGTDDPSASFIGDYGRFMVGIMAAFVVGAILQIVVAFGLWNHRKWAFIAAIPVYGLCLLGSAKSVIGAVLSLAIVVYAILRLTGNLGPRPQ